jgi:hypothetical protein
MYLYQTVLSIIGVTYTFQLTAMDPTISNTTGRASVQVVTNAPPSGGSCSSSIASSYAMGANITYAYNATIGLTCNDWTDDPTDFPLQYQFGVQTSTGVQVIVGFFQTAAQMSSLLPTGVSASGYINPLYVDIKDQYGASTRVTINNIAVTPPSSSVIIPDPVGSLTTATNSLLDSLNSSLSTSDSNAFVQNVLAITSLLSYYRDNTIVNGSYPTANVSIALRVTLFNAFLTFTGNDQRPASTDTVVQTLTILNAIVSEPTELSGSVTVNGTTNNLRVTAAIALVGITEDAFYNPNVTFTSTLGNGIVTAMDNLQAASLSVTSSSVPIAGVNGSVILSNVQNEQQTMATRLVSTIQLVTSGEMRTAVVGQDAIEHYTSRMMVSSQRQTLSGSAGLTTTPSQSLNLFDYPSNYTSVQPSFVMPSTLWDNPPVLYYNYTYDNNGTQIAAAIPTYGSWPSQVDMSFITYTNDIYQWREATVNDSSYTTSLSALQGIDNTLLLLLLLLLLPCLFA